jgi:hypothetical protein
MGKFPMTYYIAQDGTVHNTLQEARNTAEGRYDRN